MTDQKKQDHQPELSTSNGRIAPEIAADYDLSRPITSRTGLRQGLAGYGECQYSCSCPPKKSLWVGERLSLWGKREDGGRLSSALSTRAGRCPRVFLRRFRWSFYKGGSMQDEQLTDTPALPRRPALLALPAQSLHQSARLQ